MTVSEVAAVPGRRFRWTAGLVAGIIGMSLVVLTAIIAPIFLTDAATELTSNANAGPSAEHWLGTDRFGRDMLARSLVSTQLTLIMTVLASLISVGVGVLLGTTIWMAPRRIREFGLRAIDIAVSYPSLLLTLVIAAILGPSTYSAVLAIGIAGIPTFARLTSNLASSISRNDYISTARLLGVSPLRVITRHLLPNMAESLLVLGATSFALVLVELSGLSFIGLGVQTPEYDFGALLSSSLSTIYTQPFQVVGPAGMIIITGLSAMLIGDGIAAAVDPKSGQRTIAAKVATEGTRPVRTDVLVDVENLRVQGANGRTLVDGISFTVSRGEILGIVGESGSGKSLTAMALAQLLPDTLSASADSLGVNGIDLLGPVAPTTLAKSIGLIYQDPSSTFNPSLRIGPQVTEVLRAHLGFSKKAAWDRIATGLAAVHLREPQRIMRQHPHQLSGGMRQRTMIAAALAADPVLMIADEPTTALDVTVQAGILREFSAINAESSTGMIFISHDMGVVKALCHRVIVMRAGVIVEELTAQELRDGRAQHPYTQQLIKSTPQLHAAPTTGNEVAQ